MGVPFVDAPCEAEAQCCELALKGKVYGVATEDMDALTFRAPKLLRKLAGGFAPSKGAKQDVMEIDYAKMIAGLGVTEEQFVDVCILCGCDYTDTVRGVGPKKALELITRARRHRARAAALAIAPSTAHPRELAAQGRRAAAARELAAGNAERAKKLAAKKAKEARKAARLAGEDGAAADDDGGAAARRRSPTAPTTRCSPRRPTTRWTRTTTGTARPRARTTTATRAAPRRAAPRWPPRPPTSEPSGRLERRPALLRGVRHADDGRRASAPTSVETAAPGPETEAGPSGSAGGRSKRKADDEANADEEEDATRRTHDEWVPMYQQARKTFMEHGGDRRRRRSTSSSRRRRRPSSRTSS